MKAGRCGKGVMILVLLLGSRVAAARHVESRVDVRRGAFFPDLRFERLVVPESYANLGLSRAEGAFSLSDVDGEFLVLEFMNKHCIPCQTRVRRVQLLWDQLHDRGLFPRVRVLGVAAGNQMRYLNKFREKRELTYPLAADPKLEQWGRFGEPGRTPLSIFLARDGDNWVLSDYHFGVREDGWLLAETRALVAGTQGSNSSDPPAPPTGEPETRMDRLGERAAASELLSRVLGRTVRAEPLTLPDGTLLYRAGAGGGAATVYARLASLEPLCEICHGVHFFYAFDEAGTVRGFEPVHVTKWGNEPWSGEDTRSFEARLLGRKLADLEFDEEVDAVTKATISSTIIYLEIGEAQKLLEAARGL